MQCKQSVRSICCLIYVFITYLFLYFSDLLDLCFKMIKLDQWSLVITLPNLTELRPDIQLVQNDEGHHDANDSYDVKEQTHASSIITQPVCSQLEGDNHSATSSMRVESISRHVFSETVSAMASTPVHIHLM